MEIKRLKVKDIKPSPYNPRKDLKPSDPEYKSIRRSIEEFGLVDPLVVNKRNMRVVGGHQRLKILKEQGVKEVEASVVDLPEDKEKALNLALNKITGQWDIPLLQDVLMELKADGFDFEITGFDMRDIEGIAGQFEIGESAQKGEKENRGEAECPKCGFKWAV